jgi:hypothetical protein
MGVNKAEIIHVTSCLLDAIQTKTGNDQAFFSAAIEVT